MRAFVLVVMLLGGCSDNKSDPVPPPRTTGSAGSATSKPGPCCCLSYAGDGGAIAWQGERACIEAGGKCAPAPTEQCKAELAAVKQTLDKK